MISAKNNNNKTFINLYKAFNDPKFNSELSNLSKDMNIDLESLNKFKTNILSADLPPPNQEDLSEMAKTEGKVAMNGASAFLTMDPTMAKTAGKVAMNGASAFLTMDPTMMALSFVLNFLLENAVSNLSDENRDKVKKEQEDLEKFEKLVNKIFSKENFENIIKNADKLFNYLFKKDEKIDDKAVDKFLDFFEKIKIDEDKKDNAVSFLEIISNKFKDEGHEDFAEKFSKLAGKITSERDPTRGFFDHSPATSTIIETHSSQNIKTRPSQQGSFVERFASANNGKIRIANGSR